MEDSDEGKEALNGGLLMLNDYSRFTRFTEQEDAYNSGQYRLKICHNNHKLLIFHDTVIWITGNILNKRLKFDTAILDCFFTKFNDSDDLSASEAIEDVLVVAFKDKLRVYELHGISNVISFPVNIQNCYPTANGIVISRKYDHVDNVSSGPRLSPVESQMNTSQTFPIFPSVNPAASQSNIGLASSLGTMSTSNTSLIDTNFLTLSGIYSELGLIVSSSTTSFGHREELTSYPSISSQCLATTFNPADRRITVYHVRKLAKKTVNTSKRVAFPNIRKQSKRITSTGSISSLNAALDSYDFKNMRTSSNPLQFDRIISGAEFSSDVLTASSNISDSVTYRKDVIFTKLDFFAFDSDPSKLKIFNIDYVTKEAIVIVNLELKTIEILIFSKDINSFSNPKLRQSYTIKGLDAVEFKTDDYHKGYIVVLKLDGQIVLCNIFYEIFSTTIQVPDSFKVTSLDFCLNYNLSFKCNNGRHYTFLLDFRPKNGLVDVLIKSLRYLIHDRYFEIFWLRWWSNSLLESPHLNDWDSYLVTLLSFCIPDQQPTNDIQPVNEIAAATKYVPLAKTNIGFSSNDDNITMEPDLLAKIMLSIHVIREDMKLNILASDEMEKLSLLLAQMVSWSSWPNRWLEYYGVEPSLLDNSIKLNAIYRILEPPNVLLSLSSLFTNQLVQYLPFSVLAYEDEGLDRKITPRTFHILRLFEILVTPNYSNYDLIQTMVEYGLTSLNLETYPAGIYLVLKNSLLLCRGTFTSHDNMSKEMISLIGRPDLLQFQFEVTTVKHNKIIEIKKKHSRLLPDIINPIFSDKVLNPWDGEAEAEIFSVTKLLFSQDRRFYDITKILQTSKTQVINFESEKGQDDSIKLERQRYIASKITLRTMTTPIGRGAVFTSSRKPLVTEGFPIPKMTFNTLFMPENMTVTLESVQLLHELSDWGYFHNGASSGLTVSKQFTDISGSWVVFNRPPSLNAQHAGFLLGLGLNGHLTNLEEWHIYNYLSPKHSFTSIAMLLGMSASLKGTMDLKLTKVLSIHVVALLPPGSTNLNVKLSVQTAGLIGIGLLYLETQHRRMTEMLLSQISSTIEINDKKTVSEGYQLAAGIAIGYVNLGKGNQLKYNNDSHVVDSLVTLATSIRDVETSKELDKSCCGAIMGLMFMFLKTGNEEIVRKLSIPKTLQLLDYIRPDMLLLRCLAKNMIMWKDIKLTKDFIDSQIPNCLKSKYELESIYDLNSDCLAYINVLGGVLMAIGIRFASSRSEEAKELVMYYLDKLIILGSLEHDNYDERMALLGIRNVRDVVCIVISIIMAGTGDLDVLRRLRYLHSRVDENTNYGNYMAVNTALGFLFLGGGQQAFRCNDLFSIAALITSIYPVYGTNSYDSCDMLNTGLIQNQQSDIYLQALRHFWALSVENRCLVVKSVTNDKPISVKVNVFMKNGPVKLFTAPFLLPELGGISKIVTERTYEYLSVEFDFETASNEEKNKFLKSLCLYVCTQKKYNTLKLNFNEVVQFEKRKCSHRNIDTLKNMTIFDDFKDFEKDLLFDMIKGSGHEEGVIETTVFDFKRELEDLVTDESIRDFEKMLNLRLIFTFVDQMYLINSAKLKYLRGVDGQNNVINNDADYGMDIDMPELRELQYLSKEFINTLKNKILLKIIQ